MLNIKSRAKSIIQPPNYVIAALLVSIGGFLNGADTGSIGAVTEMPYFQETFGQLSPAMRGFTVSLIMLTGAVPAFFAGQLADRYGRLSVGGLGALIFLVGAVLQGAAFHLPTFLVGRALGGLGEGFYLSCISVYITEIAPSARRGSLVSMPQFFACAGVCTGYFICYGSVHLQSSMSWRLPYVVQALLAVVLVASCVFLPQSPRWLLQHGQRDKAIREIERLDFSRVEAEKDFLGPAAEHARVPQPSAVEGVVMLFRRQYRSRTMLALFVLGMVQLCGIDGVLYYAPTLFAQAGLPLTTSSFLASGLSAILMLAISIPAVLLVDRVSRRATTLIGGLLLASCMLVIGTLYASSSVHSTGSARWVVIVLVFIFCLSYCATWGIVGKIYASEIQPTQTRSSASSLAQGLGFLTNWLVAFATPIFLANSSFGAYFLFGALSLSTVIVLAIWMPETRGQSLESIQEAFGQPLGRGAAFMSHLRRLGGLLRAGDGTPLSSGPTSGLNSAAVSKSEGLELHGLPSDDATIERFPARLKMSDAC